MSDCPFFYDLKFPFYSGLNKDFSSDFYVNLCSTHQFNNNVSILLNVSLF